MRREYTNVRPSTKLSWLPSNPHPSHSYYSGESRAGKRAQDKSEQKACPQQQHSTCKILRQVASPSGFQGSRMDDFMPSFTLGCEARGEE